MKYLTFLDYSVLETTGRNIEKKLDEKELEIALLRQRDLRHEAEMKHVMEQISKLESLMGRVTKAQSQLDPEYVHAVKN